MKHKRQNTVGIVLFLLPALFLFIVFFVFPIFFVGIMSLFDWNGITDAGFAGLQNYAKIFSDKVFWRSLRNNVIWALSACFIQVPLALLMALILSKKP